MSRTPPRRKIKKKAAPPIDDVPEPEPEPLDPAAAARLRRRREARCFAANADLEKVCKLSGWTEDDIINDVESLTLMEIHWGSWTYVPKCMTHFTGLELLQISGQPLTSLTNMEQCSSLRKIHITDCRLTRMIGLEQCSNLREVYLFCNRITKMEGLDGLGNVDTLWLNDNKIKHVEGLQHVPLLKVCNLGNNLIERVDACFDCCTVIEEINISGNLIGCFREIPNFGRLPSLRSLCLNDNLFGENPVVTLCNYQTYALFHLQNIELLDGCPLSDEAKNMAEATYMKKKMYYNMRIKTMKRNCTNVLKKAQEAKQAAISQNNLSLNVLVRARKDVEREIDERTFLPPPDAVEDPAAKKSFESRLQMKHGTLEKAIADGDLEISRVDRSYELFKQTCYALVQESIGNLILELETGGNIRLEDGKSTDVWHSSCVDLVQSRFFPQDYRPFNIAGVKVTRVHRVHNRFLRNRFDARLESLVDISDSSYKKSLEYLFYGEIPGTQSLQSIMEEGFPAADSYASLSMDAAVPLSNSVSTSDLGRVKHLISEAGCEADTLATDTNMELLNSVRTGKLLIAKVYLGKYVQEHAARSADDVDKPPRSIDLADYETANSVFRVKAGDSKQRQWFIFDHALALPEYVVEFEYQLQKPIHVPTDTTRAKLLADVGLEDAASDAVRDKNGTEYGFLARPLSAFCSGCAASCASERVSQASHAAINMPPMLEARPKVFLVSEKIILEACRVSLACNIVYLNLHGNNIRKIDGLGTLTAVKTLILSFNEIQKIEGLDGLATIERLDLGYNLIKRAEGLQALPKLRALELNNNLLYRLEDVSVLKQSVPSLTELNLAHNALCEAKGYRMIVLRRLPDIVMFDNRTVDADERSAALDDTGMITDELLRRKSATGRRPTDAAKLDSDVANGSWRQDLLDIELDHCGLRRLQNLEGLVNLRRGSFSDNELTHIEGLEECTALGELLLEENRIVRLDGLRNLVYLKRLDVGKNKLTKIEGLGTLTRLTQLSIEDNEITSLAGLSKLASLMELYIGNNRVTDLKEVHHVKELSKLIILDLSGNKLCTAQDYRHYTIYHVRKLKVLDGAGVEMMEQEAAKEKYDGKLTVEFVVERVGHSFLEHVRELNLAASRVRDLGDVMTQASFPGLKEINLDNNQLTDLSGLLDLPLLTVLRLNHNRVEHLGAAGGDETRTALPHLEVLQLGYNHINYIPSLRLHCFPELRSLYLQGNDIAKIEGLERCLQLRELILDKNKLKSIAANSLSGLSNLRTLRIDENGLRSLSNIAPLPRLQILSCVSNRVTELVSLLASLCRPSLLCCVLLAAFCQR
eukprot:COSAG05_NODE_539_length_8851_cov_3.718693_2_plen_1327_part_00